MDPPANEITLLLQSWSQGDEGAIEKLIPLVYDELHRLARRYMSNEKPGHTLQTTALVNEAYLRLVDSAQAELGGPDPLLRGVRAGDAAHSGGLGAFAAGAETRQRSGLLWS